MISMSKSEEEQQLTADPELLEARDTALNTLFEVAEMEHVGPLTGHRIHEERLVTLLFESLVPGYRGWNWAVTLTKAESDGPITVSETNMEPGDDSLLAPEWIPWADRLAAFREAQELQAAKEAELAEQAARELEDEDEVDPEDDLLENDFSGFDDELDGVDVDLFS